MAETSPRRLKSFPTVVRGPTLHWTLSRSFIKSSPIMNCDVGALSVCARSLGPSTSYSHWNKQLGNEENWDWISRCIFHEYSFKVRGSTKKMRLKAAADLGGSGSSFVCIYSETTIRETTCTLGNGEFSFFLPGMDPVKSIPSPPHAVLQCGPMYPYYS